MPTRIPSISCPFTLDTELRPSLFCLHCKQRAASHADRPCEHEDQRVSVVIPAYNEKENIGICIDRILQQTVRPDELIVADNNSVDATASIATGYGARVLFENRQGMIHVSSVHGQDLVIAVPVE